MLYSYSKIYKYIFCFFLKVLLKFFMGFFHERFIFFQKLMCRRILSRFVNLTLNIFSHCLCRSLDNYPSFFLSRLASFVIWNILNINQNAIACLIEQKNSFLFAMINVVLLSSYVFRRCTLTVFTVFTNFNLVF